jgi:hypothetical protein
MSELVNIAASRIDVKVVWADNRTGNVEMYTKNIDGDKT